MGEFAKSNIGLTSTFTFTVYEAVTTLEGNHAALDGHLCDLANAPLSSLSVLLNKCAANQVGHCGICLWSYPTTMSVSVDERGSSKCGVHWPRR